MLKKFIVKMICSYRNIERCLRRNINLDRSYYKNQSILMLCIKYDMKKEAGLLIKSGVDLNIRDNDGRTALQLAIIWGKYDMAEMLIKNGAKVDNQDEKGRTATYYATKIENVELLDLLVKNGADVDIQDEFGISPVVMAIADKKHKVLDCLIENSKRLEDITLTGRMTPLHIAAKLKNEKAVEKLIIKGVNVDVLDDCMQTALMYAVKKGYTKIAKILIENGANVNVVDETNSNVKLIDLACFRGYVDMVDLLVENNAKITENLKDWALYREEDEIIRKINILHPDNKIENTYNAEINIKKMLRKGKTFDDIEKFAVDNNKPKMLQKVIKLKYKNNIKFDVKYLDKGLVFKAVVNNNVKIFNILLKDLTSNNERALSYLVDNNHLNMKLKDKEKSDARDQIKQAKQDIQNQCILNCIYKSKRANIAKTMHK